MRDVESFFRVDVEGLNVVFATSEYVGDGI